MESAMETNKDAKVVSKKKQNIVYSEVKAISHIGKKKYGTDDFETITPLFLKFCYQVLRSTMQHLWHTFENTYLHMSHCIYNTYSEGECVAKDGWKSDTKILAT